MQTNLAIHILLHLIRKLKESEGEGVKLSDIRHRWGVPASTFYRHVNSLMQCGIVAREERDRYVLRVEFIGDVSEVQSRKNRTYLPDRQLSFIRDEIPF